MLKKVLVVFAVLIAVLVAVIAAQPADYRVERSLSMKAPAKIVFDTVADFSTFEKWSPWAALDPGMKKEIKGTGKGATYYWNGNDQVGEGRMTITNVVEPSKIDIGLEFIRPFASKAETGWTIAADGEGSKVTWWMTGHNNFVAKAMGLVMNFEEMIGKDYDKGLGALKPIVEAKAVEAAEAAKAAEVAAAAPAEGAEGAAAGEAGAAPAEGDAKEATP